MRLVSASFLLLSGVPLSAQTTPLPGTDDPRLQTLVERPGEPARLVSFPDASLTLIMQKGERVERVLLSDSSAFRVTLTGDNDSVSITPLKPAATATMEVETTDESHQFTIETGRGLSAAFVVRLVGSAAQMTSEGARGVPPDLAAMTGRYRIGGDRAVRPTQIADDGAKTYIAWASEQSLPAVLGIGPTGQEEVVAGHMRAGLFTIDRVYPELVFRIDRQKAVATRETPGVRQ